MNWKIYGKEWCVYCNRAKKLFDDLKISYDYYDIEKDDDARKWALERSNGQRTVPIIFTPTNEFVGGFDELRIRLKDYK